MNKQLKIVLLIIVVFAMAANLALFALQLPVVESEPKTEIESELNNLEADLFGRCLSIHVFGIFATLPKLSLSPGYMLRLIQTNIRFFPFFRSDLHALSPPQINL